MTKKRYTTKQLKRWYEQEIEEILSDYLKSYEYKTLISVPVKTIDFLQTNSDFVNLCQYAGIIDNLFSKEEIGKIYGVNIEINKKKELLIKIKKLKEKNEIQGN